VEHSIVRYFARLLRVWLSSRVFSFDPSQNNLRLLAPLLGFLSLQHQSESQVHLTIALPTILVTPSGFDYPPDVFLPEIPSKLFFKLTALLGFSPSKRSRVMRYENISAVIYPPVVYFMLDTSLRWYGHINRGFWVFFLVTDPGIGKFWTCLLPKAPLEFSFLGFAASQSCFFSEAPLVCLVVTPQCGMPTCTSEYQSINCW
jgi:hypothetical protein